MEYLHIPNLYKAQEILMFKRCYALEKIHGTSANVCYTGTEIRLFSGGERMENFARLFDTQVLLEKFTTFGITPVTVFGEAYGGKCQGMSKTYGKELRFVAFDVKVGDSWLTVPQAEEVARGIGLDFVHWLEISATMELIDAARDMDSMQAFKNGQGNGFIREGVVLRPLIECRTNNGDRIIAKHKRPEFSERASIPNVDPAKREILRDAQKIADEWVTPNRLQHVIDRYRADNPHHDPLDEAKTGDIIRYMVEDVTREAAGEIVDHSAVRKALGGKTAQIFKRYLRV